MKLKTKPTIRAQVWQALRIATAPMTVRELVMVIEASDSAIKLQLYEWIDMNLIVARSSPPRKQRGRRSLTYWLIDKTVVYPPRIKKDECK
jgi:predicted transcriptional regulator